jgi:hypothetical protein
LRRTHAPFPPFAKPACPTLRHSPNDAGPTTPRANLPLGPGHGVPARDAEREAEVFVFVLSAAELAAQGHAGAGHGLHPAFPEISELPVQRAPSAVMKASTWHWQSPGLSRMLTVPEEAIMTSSNNCRICGVLAGPRSREVAPREVYLRVKSVSVR